MWKSELSQYRASWIPGLGTAQLELWPLAQKKQCSPINYMQEPIVESNIGCCNIRRSADTGIDFEATGRLLLTRAPKRRSEHDVRRACEVGEALTEESSVCQSTALLVEVRAPQRKREDMVGNKFPSGGFCDTREVGHPSVLHILRNGIVGRCEEGTSRGVQLAQDRREASRNSIES